MNKGAGSKVRKTVEEKKVVCEWEVKAEEVKKYGEETGIWVGRGEGGNGEKENKSEGGWEQEVKEEDRVEERRGEDEVEEGEEEEEDCGWM